jgi:ABC-type nitrate/sulfonate/bicarbonate transport system substrate-binding protein
MNPRISILTFTILFSIAAAVPTLYAGDTNKVGKLQANLSPNPGNLPVVKTWTRLDCTAAPVIVAEKLGFFTDAGIHVVYTGETGVPLRIASIIKGDNDMGDAHPNELAIARANGATVRGFVRSIVEPPNYIRDKHLSHMWWVSDKTGPIKTLSNIKDYPGKVKIQFITRNACMDFVNDKILQKYGIPRDKLEYVTMPDIEGILSLKKGLIQIAVIHPPFYKTFEEWSNGNLLATSRDFAGENGGTYLYYTSDRFLKEHPKEVIAFTEAIKKAERWINRNPKQAADWTAEEIGVPVNANHFYAEDARINDKHIQEWIDSAVKSGVIEDKSVKVSDVVTHDFENYGNDPRTKVPGKIAYK